MSRFFRRRRRLLHGPWGKVKQAEWLDQFYRIALSKACIDGVMYSNFTDVADSVVPESGLMTRDSNPRSRIDIERFRDRILAVTDYRYEQDQLFAFVIASCMLLFLVCALRLAASARKAGRCLSNWKAG